MYTRQLLCHRMELSYACTIDYSQIKPITEKLIQINQNNIQLISESIQDFIDVLTVIYEDCPAYWNRTMKFLPICSTVQGFTM